MDFEVGPVGEFLMDKHGYRQETAWLHERVQNTELDGSAEVDNVSTNSHNPLRGKIRISIEKPEDPDFEDKEEAEEWVDSQIIPLFEELLPEARITSTRPKYFGGSRTSGYVLFCID